MEPLKERRTVVIASIGLALLAGLGIAAFLAIRGAGPADVAPPSQGGLIVQTGRDDDIKLDPRRPLRCFVNGQLVGKFTLGECARRNGVASGALDVGLDPTGALAAANGASGQITPLPPGARSDAGGEQTGPAVPGVAVTTAAAPCWLYVDARWSRLPRDLPLAACIEAVYPDRCARADGPVYGRWGDSTLRLLEGRIEISANNRDFRLLADRAAACDPSRGD